MLRVLVRIRRLASLRTCTLSPRRPSRTTFDPAAWLSNARSSSSSSSRRPLACSAPSLGGGTGLFGREGLDRPEGFDRVTKRSLEEASCLVEAISNMADAPSQEVIQLFDDLSDVLCKVADLAECVRQVHGDKHTVSKAQAACVAINSYVEELNTDTSLHRALRRFMDSSEFDSLDEVSRRTAESFMHDFEISGIHLEARSRKTAVNLNKRILELSHTFHQMASQPAALERSQCPPLLLDKFPSDDSHVLVTHVPFASANADLRALSYLVFFGNFPALQETLETLLSLRHELASLVGYSTFSHRVLKSSMAETPENVAEFLDALTEAVGPLARTEVDEMLRLREANSNGRSGSSTALLRPWDTTFIDNFTKTEVDDLLRLRESNLNGGSGSSAALLHPWDVTFVNNLAQTECFPDGLDGLEEHFSVDACLDGLGGLFQALFGVRLERAPVTSGEVWDDSVVKLAFVDERDGLLGYTYCDLFARSTKSAEDCHFTIQGGRELPDGSYQLPVITLCCSFQPTWVKGRALLSHRMVENLFHEMGHALHSMLGRPRYQNVTGTRCSTDFAEVPSILMEFFLSDSRVLSSFARHHETGSPLPAHLMTGFQVSQNFFPAFDTQLQVLYATMDQKFHGTHPLGKSTVDIFSSLHSVYSPLAYTPHTAWFLRFSHLYGYAAKYYSYLWSRAVASLIWNSCFDRDPFSRTVGERYREMLRYGGGVHPQSLVRGVLGFEPSVADLVAALHADVVRQRERIGTLRACEAQTPT